MKICSVATLYVTITGNQYSAFPLFLNGCSHQSDGYFYQWHDDRQMILLLFWQMCPVGESLKDFCENCDSVIKREFWACTKKFRSSHYLKEENILTVKRHSNILIN